MAGCSPGLAITEPVRPWAPPSPRCSLRFALPTLPRPPKSVCHPLDDTPPPSSFTPPPIRPPSPPGNFTLQPCTQPAAPSRHSHRLGATHHPTRAPHRSGCHRIDDIRIRVVSVIRQNECHPMDDIHSVRCARTQRLQPNIRTEAMLPSPPKFARLSGIAAGPRASLEASSTGNGAMPGAPRTRPRHGRDLR